MHNSKPITVLALILILGVWLPLPCFGLLAGGIISAQTTMPGGCHGHRHMPSPVHRCCYPDHQVPAATPVAPTTVDVIAFTEHASAPVAVQSVQATSLGSGGNDSPPSPALVLRI